MASPVLQYLLNEASSGTTPANALNSGSASSSDLPITYGSATWTSIASGRALQFATGSNCENASVGSAVNTALSGSKTVSVEFLHQVTVQGTSNGGIFGCFKVTPEFDTIGIDYRAGNGGYQVFYQTVADGSQEAAGVSVSNVIGTNVVQFVLDTAATNRITAYLNGFSVFTSNTGITANTTLDTNGGPLDVYATQNTTLSGTQALGYLGLYSTALTGADCLAHALRLFADSDTGPNVAGAQLRAAGTNGGTNDASTSTADPTAAATQTVGASGLNRGLFACITGFAVSTGVTVCTFNGVAGTRITGGTSTGSSDAEIWWWNDAALPGSAGTYSSVVTVDGAAGTVAVTLHYDEGVAQTAPTNFIVTTGTGTSITGTLPSSVAAGSILHGVLFDVTVADTAVAAANQLPLSVVNGTSTGNTHRHTSGAKYVPTAGSNSMSWSGLTNATAKIIVVVEVFVAATSAPTANRAATNPPIAGKLSRALPPFWPPAAIGSFANAVALPLPPAPPQGRTPPTTVPGVFNRNIPPFWPPSAVGSFQNASTQLSGSGSAALSSLGAVATGLLTFAAIGTAALSSLAATASGAESFPGTATAALSSFACSAVGTEAFTGTGSAACQSLAGTAAGTEAFSGSGSAACSSFSSSGTGTEAFSGSGAAACSSLTVTGTGAANGAIGSGSAALSSCAATSAGTETFTGSGSAACSSFAVSGSGTETVSCTGSAALSSIGATGVGSLGTVFTGSGSTALSQLALNSSGVEAFAATGTASCSSFASAGAGTETVSCTGSASLSSFAVTGNGVLGNNFAGSGAATISSIASASTGTQAFAASGSAACSSLAAAGACLESFAGSGGAACSSFTVTGSGAQGAVVTGSGSAALSQLASSGAGAESVVGSGTAALKSLACSATGSEAFAGAGGGACSSLGASGVGAFAGAITGSGSAALSILGVIATGLNILAITGSGSAACSSIGASGNGICSNGFAPAPITRWASVLDATGAYRWAPIKYVI